MNCQRCGASAIEGARFCQNCGAPIATREAPIHSPSEIPSVATQSPPSQREIPLQVRAGFWRRLLAYLIDSLVLTLAGVPVAIGMYGHAWLDRVFPFVAQETPRFTDAPYIALLTLISVLYFWLLTAARGQTLGKMALKLVVIRQDGSRIGIGRALLRYLAYYLSSVTLLIGFLMAAGRTKRALHDRLVGTLVVKQREVGRWRETESLQPRL